jgi:WD domain, G-beta repeat
MAPERFRGEGDARADLYALGLTLYELMTLRPAFVTSDRLKLIEEVKNEEPARPRSLDARSNIAETSAAQQLQNSSTGVRPLQAAPEEHRNWEWRHLESQLDGTRLAVGCADTTIRLIDVAHRHEGAALRGHTDSVHAVAWSPDGTRLVSGSGDYTVRVWDSLSIQARARASQGKTTH